MPPSLKDHGQGEFQEDNDNATNNNVNKVGNFASATCFIYLW